MNFKNIGITIGLLLVLSVIVYMLLLNTGTENNQDFNDEKKEDVVEDTYIEVEPELEEGIGIFHTRSDHSFIQILEGHTVDTYALDDSLRDGFEDKNINTNSYISFNYYIEGESKVIKEISLVSLIEVGGEFIEEKEDILVVEINGQKNSFKLAKETNLNSQELNSLKNNPIKLSYFELNGEKIITEIGLDLHEELNILGVYNGYEDGTIEIVKNDAILKLKTEGLKGTEDGTNISYDLNLQQGAEVVFSYYIMNEDAFLVSVIEVDLKQMERIFVGIYDEEFIEIQHDEEIIVYEMYEDLIKNIKDIDLERGEVLTLEYFERHGQKIITSVR